MEQNMEIRNEQSETVIENQENSNNGGRCFSVDSDHYIENRLQGQMNYYHSACMHLQKEYNWLSILNIITTAIIPVFTLAIDDMDFFKYIVAVLGAVASVFTSILLLHKTKENQVNYRSTYETLKIERIYYTYGIEKYKEINNGERQELFIETCETIMKGEHRTWENLKKS